MIKWNVWTAEYHSTSKHCPGVGVPEAMIPSPPEGRGWKLEAASISGSTVYYWWKRIRWTPFVIPRSKE